MLRNNETALKSMTALMERALQPEGSTAHESIRAMAAGLAAAFVKGGCVGVLRVRYLQTTVFDDLSASADLSVRLERKDGSGVLIVLRLSCEVSDEGPTLKLHRAFSTASGQDLVRLLHTEYQLADDIQIVEVSDDH